MEKSESRRNRIGGQMAGLYDLEETIGEGHYAVVKLARHVFTGEKVAVKVIDKMKLDAATRIQMMQEVRLMKLVQHPYVVRLYEVIDTQTKLYLVLEFADGGDMYDHIMKHEGGLEERTARKYFKQIVTAIQYCHKLHVVHRDLKPENVVFFEKQGMVKLTDFGFSNKFDPGQRLQTSCGSLAYSAPEILLGDSYDAPAVDIWSLGVILYMLVCGTAPFQEANDSETLTMIMDCKYSFPSHITQQCKSLISRMLQREPEVRASLEDIVQDSWLFEENFEDSSLPEEERFPLVSREHLTDEEHSSVLQRMVNGSIGLREDIISALDRNEYNHITATYFLLAERKLRMQRSDQNVAKQQGLGLQKGQVSSLALGGLGIAGPHQKAAGGGAASLAGAAGAKARTPTTPSGLSELEASQLSAVAASLMVSSMASPAASPTSAASPPLPPIQMSSSVPPPTRRLPSKKISLPPLLSSPIVEQGLLTPSEAMAARRKCTIVEEDDEEAYEEEQEIIEAKIVRDDSCVSRSSRSSIPDAHHNLDLAWIHGQLTSSKPLISIEREGSTEATPAPFPVTSQIGTGLSRQGSLRRSETSGSNSGAGSPSTTPPGSTPSSSQGSPARYKLTGPRKLANTRSSPQLILNQIHEESEEGQHSMIDPVDNFPQTSAGVAVIRRLEQRRRLKFHKARTTSCSSSDASDDETNAASDTKRPPRPEKTPTPPPLGSDNNKDPHDDSSDSNQGPGTSTSSGMTSILTSRSRSRTTQDHHGTGSQQGQGQQHKGQQDGLEGQSHVLTSSSSTNSSRPRNRGGHLTRVRQSRSLNRISELHVVADFSESETDLLKTTDLLTRYLDTVHSSVNNRSATRSRDDSQTSSDGEFEPQTTQQQSQPRRSKVNLRLLEQRLNKIQEESLNKNEDQNEAAEDGDVSDNVSTVADDFVANLPTKTICIDAEDKENNQGRRPQSFSETTSVKSCSVVNNNINNSSNSNGKRPRLNRAHSCGSLFSLKERALLRQKLSSHVTAAFWDILQSSTNAVTGSSVTSSGHLEAGHTCNGVGHSAMEVNHKKQQQDLTLALKTNPLAVFQLQSTSRCCNLC